MRIGQIMTAATTLLMGLRGIMPEIAKSAIGGAIIGGAMLNQAEQSVYETLTEEKMKQEVTKQFLHIVKQNEELKAAFTGMDQPINDLFSEVFTKKFTEALAKGGIDSEQSLAKIISESFSTFISAELEHQAPDANMSLKNNIRNATQSIASFVEKQTEDTLNSLLGGFGGEKDGLDVKMKNMISFITKNLNLKLEGSNQQMGDEGDPLKKQINGVLDGIKEAVDKFRTDVKFDLGKKHGIDLGSVNIKIPKEPFQNTFSFIGTTLENLAAKGNLNDFPKNFAKQISEHVEKDIIKLLKDSGIDPEKKDGKLDLSPIVKELTGQFIGLVKEPLKGLGIDIEKSVVEQARDFLDYGINTVQIKLFGDMTNSTQVGATNTTESKMTVKQFIDATSHKLAGTLYPAVKEKLAENNVLVKGTVLGAAVGGFGYVLGATIFTAFSLLWNNRNEIASTLAAPRELCQTRGRADSQPLLPNVEMQTSSQLV